MAATTTPTGRRVSRSVLLSLGVVVAAVAAAAILGRPGREGPPLDPRSDAPLGTSALVSLLRELGASVELSVGLPGGSDDVALLLEDRLDAEQTDEVEHWVEAGGTLVVTDPASSLTPPVLDQGLAPGEASPDRGRCTVDALRDVRELDAGAASRFEVEERDAICFGSAADGAFVVATELGRGTVVAIGGAALLTNDLLDESDNAVLAADLLAPTSGTTVRFVDAPLPAGGGSKTLGDLIAPGVRRGLVQLAIAFVLYALWRAIRLGRPVAEDLPVEIAGSELVSAVGRMLSRTRAPGAAAAAIRMSLRRSLRTRFGVAPSASPATLAAVVAARTGLDPERVLAAVDDRPVSTDDELLALANAASSIHQEVLL